MAFYYSKWLALPITVRHELAGALGISKTGPTHVDTDRVVSDGYSIEAVESVITPDNLRAFLKTDEKDEEELFAMLLRKDDVVEAPVSPEKEEVTAPAPGTLEASNAKPEHVKAVKPVETPAKKPITKKK